MGISLAYILTVRKKGCKTASMNKNNGTQLMTDTVPSYREVKLPPPAIGAYSLDPDFTISFHVPFYPCWFYRAMQRVLLGVYWKKLP